MGEHHSKFLNSVILSASELGSLETNQARLALGETLLPPARYAVVLELTQQVIGSDQPEFLLLY
jgi:hypothetical protein